MIVAMSAIRSQRGRSRKEVIVWCARQDLNL